MPSTRKLLLDAIATLDAGTPPDVCADALDEIFVSCSNDDGTSAAFDDEKCAGGVTPLMIACDKSIASALNYLRQQIQHVTTKEVFSAWGYVPDKSESGNCAAHHALAADFQIGLDVLEYYAFNATPHLSPDTSNLQRYMSLLKQPNENGDTPIMMACVYGHSDIIGHILKRSYHLSSTASNNSNSETIVKNTWQSLSELFGKRNEEGCSALNLACGHGHVDIVQLLILTHSVCEKQGTMELNISSSTGDVSEIKSKVRETAHKVMPLVTVTYDDVRRCQSTIDNLEYGLKMMKQNRVAATKQEEFQQQHTHALTCLEMMNGELHKIAAETANSLLTHHEGMQDQSHSTKKTKVKASTKKKKKKEHAKPKQQEKPHIDSSIIENAINSETTSDGWCVETKSNGDDNLVPSTSTSPFITLHDGRVISKSHTAEDVPCEDGSVDKSTHVTSAPKTLESILQSNPRYDGNAATTMESLCLDPSMLLLSAHGMAITMSPCQLDAIKTILTNQLSALKEAHKIQSRLLNNNNERGQYD